MDVRIKLLEEQIKMLKVFLDKVLIDKWKIGLRKDTKLKEADEFTSMLIKEACFQRIEELSLKIKEIDPNYVPESEE